MTKYLGKCERKNVLTKPNSISLFVLFLSFQVQTPLWLIHHSSLPKIKPMKHSLLQLRAVMLNQSPTQVYIIINLIFIPNCRIFSVICCHFLPSLRLSFVVRLFFLLKINFRRNLVLIFIIFFYCSLSISVDTWHYIVL